MNFDKNKVKAVFATFLVLTFAATLVALPTANAQVSRKTYAFIGAKPNPVGVGQEVLLHIGITDYTAWPQEGWTGLTVTVTRPDGKTETLGPYSTDTTGGTGIVYVPTMTGNYTLQMHFPQQTNTAAVAGYPVGTIFQASDSEILTLVVQESPIQYYPGVPLPTEYWSRPINAQLREWLIISGNWLVPTPILPVDNLYAPYNDDAPESAHILWTKPIGDTMGGLAGGIDNIGYGIGDAYEGKWASGCIISGVLFYNRFDAASPTQQVVAVDIHTGKELWAKSLMGNGRISFGQVLRWKSLNYQGAFSYIWVVSGTSWYAFEPLSGEWKYNMTNVPAGSNYYGPQGEILRYTVNTAAGWMAQWNTTTVTMKGATGMTLSWGRQVQGKQYDATNGYDWNVSIPMGLPGSVRMANPLDRIIGAAISTKEVTLWALSLAPGKEGQLLYNTTWKAPADWSAGNETINWGVASFTDNIAVLYSKERNNYYGFNLTNGQFLWGPTPSEQYLNTYDRISTINYGRLISSGCSGIVYCYNASTGELLWTYEAEDPYTESLTGDNWWMQQLFITDGKVYLGHVEHSPNQPLPRGAPFICLDVETGAEVWKMSGGFRQTCWGGKAMIADSIIVLQDTYDQRIYAIGKGPSATTVTASPKVSVCGSSVLVEGTVTDISPGTEEYALAARFPHGVPAVSDESMSDWMLYVYKQFPRPTNAKGVEVVIEVLDPNNNYYEVARTTSDSSGYFGCEFTPPVPGLYKIIASFKGSKSYYGSYAETFITVEDAPAATPEPTPSPQAPVETYFAASTIAIIVAIAIVGILLFRKRS